MTDADVLVHWADAIEMAEGFRGLGARCIRELAAEVRALRGVVAQVQEFTEGGLYEDGGHHKQWYLEQIANVVGFKPSDDDAWEEGIAP